MPKTLTRTALVSSATNTAGSTTRGRLDCSAVDGGLLTMAVTNGGTGPTIACTMRILVAHKDTSMPAAASEGTGDGDWKILREILCPTTANAKTRLDLEFGPGYSYLEVEFTGNTVQSVTVEAIATTYTY